MEEGIVYLESSTDLTPVLEAMEQLREQLETIAAGELALTGVVLGVMVIVPPRKRDTPFFPVMFK